MLSERTDVSQELEQHGESRSARSFTTDIAPHWDERIGKLLFRRALPKKAPARVLDIHCAHGYTTQTLVEGLHPDSQVLALQADPSLAALAQSKLRACKHRVHLREGNFDDVTALPDGQFEFVCANLVLGQSVPDWKLGLSEIYRVLAPGGQARASLTLQGTWHDATQLVLEQLAAHNATWAHDQLQAIQSNWPQPKAVLEHLQSLVHDPGDIDLEIDRFEILFSSARDFFRAPLVEHGPLALWRALLRKHPDPGAMLWRLREAFDAHYEGHVLALPIVAGVATLRKPKNKRRRKALTQESLAPYPQLRRLCYPPQKTGVPTSPTTPSPRTSADLAPPISPKKAPA